ncbi:DUF2207 domain-containing protein [Methanobrevibacter boviskoreani]|uniref:DUF2207 domain-containing protein n=1 Tax=Methanobrevibacter boviskoreani TaxID=1348249 RepID=UPI0005929302|nr:DUF2207 domain-containing protein [Methanobrevibacter boviskoreani]
MDKKIVGILIILTIALALIPTITADDDRSYDITRGIVNLTVDSNGNLQVLETYTYDFKGTFHGVNREIPVKDGEGLTNYSVTTDGAYNSVSVSNEDNYKEFTVNLYKDPAKTQAISDCEVNVTYNYTMKNTVKIYNDVGEVQYKVWGGEWDQGISNFTACLNVPSRNGVEYWINPKNFDGTSKWTQNTLQLHTDYRESDEYIELRAAIPRSEFNPNPTDGNIINKNGLDEIKKIQSEYNTKYDIANMGCVSTIILEFIYIVSVVGIYLKYGREPKIEYNGIYEREPPTDDSPTFINAMIPDRFKNVGDLNDNGFKACIMELINDGYLKIVNRDNITENKSNNIRLEVTDKDQSNLEFYQKHAINILKGFMYNGVIDFKMMENDLKNEENAERFNNVYRAWKTSFISRNIPESIKREYFDDTGSVYIMILSLIILVTGIILGYFLFGTNVELESIGFVGSIALIASGIIGLLLPSTFGGRWSNEGKEFEMKWLNFKKYLNDYSLIKEYPPESIEIWNKYLIYATALGVAKTVEKAMNSIAYNNITDSYYYNNDVFMFSYFGGMNALESAITTGINTINTYDIGDIGGGSGGGGGGAF